MTTAKALPAWIRDQRRANGICEQCGEEQAATQWAGTGELICWTCCEKRQDAYAARLQGNA